MEEEIETEQNLVNKILKGRNPEEMAMRVIYKNYKGVEEIRNVVPLYSWYGSTEWHQEYQWLLKVWDLDRKAIRDYALKDWKGAP